MSNYSQDLTIVLNKNLPDKDIELFWYNYKNYICNFFTNIHFSDNISSYYLYIKNELDIISNKLNNYQSQHNWNNIQILISNFQIFISFYFLQIIKKKNYQYIQIRNAYILYLKFIKRWNNINFVQEVYKIKLDNWDTNTRLECKLAIVFSIICRNMKMSKFEDFKSILIQYYNMDLSIWNKLNYSLIETEHFLNQKQNFYKLINNFLNKITIIFLFDKDNNVSLSSISILDIISKVYHFKKLWFKQNQDKIHNNFWIDNMSTKKFCIKLKNILKKEHFENL
jgi:hypothetical protein